MLYVTYLINTCCWLIRIDHFFEWVRSRKPHFQERPRTFVKVVFFVKLHFYTTINNKYTHTWITDRKWLVNNSNNTSCSLITTTKDLRELTIGIFVRWRNYETDKRLSQFPEKDILGFRGFFLLSNVIVILFLIHWVYILYK